MTHNELFTRLINLETSIRFAKNHAEREYLGREWVKVRDALNAL